MPRYDVCAHHSSNASEPPALTGVSSIAAQGFAHPSRKVVSATTPVGGFSAVHEISKPGGSGAAVIRRGDGWTSPPATRSARFSVGGSRTGSGTESGSWSRIGSRNGSRKDSCDDARGDRVRKGISKGGNESSWFDGGDGMGASSVGEWTSVAIDCEVRACVWHGRGRLRALNSLLLTAGRSSRPESYRALCDPQCRFSSMSDVADFELYFIGSPSG